MPAAHEAQSSPVPARGRAVRRLAEGTAGRAPRSATRNRRITSVSPIPRGPRSAPALPSLPSWSRARCWLHLAAAAAAGSWAERRGVGAGTSPPCACVLPPHPFPCTQPKNLAAHRASASPRWEAKRCRNVRRDRPETPQSYSLLSPFPYVTKRSGSVALQGTVHPPGGFAAGKPQGDRGMPWARTSGRCCPCSPVPRRRH